MKKVIFIAAIAVTGLATQAQTMFGIQAGVNLATVKSEFPGASSSTSKAATGITIGALAEVPFGSSINFRPELNFIQKGGEEDNTYTAGSTTTKINSKLKLGYVQLSPNFVYNMAAGSGNIFFGAGPEFSLGIAGKSKDKTVTTTPGSTTTTEENTDVKFDGNDNATATDNKFHLKSFDYGVNLLAGYKISNGVFFSAGYTFGLGNVSPDANSSFKNSGFNIKLGYMFGGSGTTTAK